MFQCNQCGECCRHLDQSEIYQDLDRGDGICRFLEGDSCSIYQNRPLMCQVDRAYEEIFKDVYTKEEYYRMNYEACRKLQENRRR